MSVRGLAKSQEQCKGAVNFPPNAMEFARKLRIWCVPSFLPSFLPSFASGVGPLEPLQGRGTAAAALGAEQWKHEL